MSQTVLNNDKVLVTGGAGFIPSHLVDLLVESGARVVVLDDLSAGKIENLGQVKNHVEFVEGSILDVDLLDNLVAGSRFVFNFAANADVPRSVKYPDLDFHTNAVGAFNVFSACRKHDVERVLQASTAAVYGEPEYVPMDEMHRLNPISPYGASKLGAESLLMAYHKTYDLGCTVVRIFNTYGPRQPRYVMYDLFRKLEKNRSQLEVLGTGQQVRDYCYVSDTATAFLSLALNEKANGEVFNIAGGQPVSIADLVTIILDTLNLTATDVHYTGQSWPGDIKRLIADITKIQGAGFKPTVDLNEGLRRFAEWIDI